MITTRNTYLIEADSLTREQMEDYLKQIRDNLRRKIESTKKHEFTDESATVVNPAHKIVVIDGKYYYLDEVRAAIDSFIYKGVPTHLKSTAEKEKRDKELYDLMREHGKSFAERYHPYIEPAKNGCTCPCHRDYRIIHCAPCC